MTKRKSMRGAGVPDEVALAIRYCHDWLLGNAEPPGLVADLPPELRIPTMEAARKDPERLIALGPATGEDPWSKAGLVRALLRDWLATRRFDELPDRLRTAEDRGDPAAFLLDDRRTREALPLLHHGLRGLNLLQQEAEMREARLPRLGYESPPNARTIELIAGAKIALEALVDHVRNLGGGDAPRGLAELIQFRATWASWLDEAGFELSEIARLLGQVPPDDPLAQARFRDALRKGRTRGPTSGVGGGV